MVNRRIGTSPEVLNQKIVRSNPICIKLIISFIDICTVKFVGCKSKSHRVQTRERSRIELNHACIHTNYRPLGGSVVPKHHIRSLLVDGTVDLQHTITTHHEGASHQQG